MSMPSGVMLQRMPKNPMVLEHARKHALGLYLEKKKYIISESTRIDQTYNILELDKMIQIGMGRPENK